jgi:hypothetical protein
MNNKLRMHVLNCFENLIDDTTHKMIFRTIKFFDGVAVYILGDKKYVIFIGETSVQFNYVWMIQ